MIGSWITQKKNVFPFQCWCSNWVHFCCCYALSSKCLFCLEVS